MSQAGSAAAYVRGAAIVLCAWFVAAFIGIMLVRLFYPYELEWLEGAMLRIVERAYNGESLYAEPTLEYTMHVYAPLYYWISGGLWHVFGPGPFAPRLVSVVASIATLLLIWKLVRRFGAGRFAAFAAVGLYAATFEPGDAYHDTVRVDALFVLLLTLSMYGLIAWRGAVGAVAAGVVLALAFAAKQSAMLVPVPMFFACWWARGLREAVLFAVTAIALFGVELGALHVTSDGWSTYFLLGQLTQHAIEPNMVRGFWTFDMGRVVGLAFVAAFWHGLVLLKRHDRDSILLGAAAATMVGIGYASRLHSGGAENVIYPAWLAVAVLAALAFDSIKSHRLRVVGLALLVLQLAYLVYITLDIGRLWPTRADREAGDGFVTALRDLDGPTLVPFHGWLAETAGKSAGGHPVAIIDVLRSNDDSIIDDFKAASHAAFESGRYRYVVMDATINDPWLETTVPKYFERIGTLPGSEGYRWINARGSYEIELYTLK